ncbi:MAG: hypothetical protein JJT81_13425 [Rubellimicrobium sp.]|nr:hypothetical protein [Rubellimicrobium sp.]
MFTRPLLAVSVLGSLALAACAPAGTGPSAPPASPRDALVAAIEANGCLLTADNVGDILIRANLTQADLIDLTPQLAAEGRAEVAQSGAIRVLTDNCI